MKHIAYYISDYGFGHAARSIAVIRRFLRKDFNIHVTICCSFALEFVRESLQGEFSNRIDFRRVMNDFGYVLKENSIEVDEVQMGIAYSKYMSDSEAYLEQEIPFLQENRIDLVITDISPLPVMAANRAYVAAIGISNFTWYSAYEGIIDGDQLKWMFHAYQGMDYFIPLAGENEPRWKGKWGRPVPFFCREINQEKVRTIHEMLNPDGNNFLVYFGLGMKISMDDLSALEIWNSDDCVFIVSGNTPVKGPNIYRIPEHETETQNYIAACDLVISKPGWATVSEAVGSRSPMLIINRSFMREDQNTIHYLKEHHLGFDMSWDDFRHFRINHSVKQELKKWAAHMESDNNDFVLESVINQIQSILYR